MTAVTAIELGCRCQCHMGKGRCGIIACCKASGILTGTELRKKIEEVLRVTTAIEAAPLTRREFLWQVPAAELEAYLGHYPRTTDWIQLYSGRKFWPLEPHPSDVFIQDIAHNLANMCRFGGCIYPGYSVAEHCVRVSWLCPTLEALLHEGDECWGMPDLTRPVKYHPDFRKLWDYYGGQQQAAVNLRFGLDPHLKSPEVKQADNILLITEQRDLQGAQIEPWTKWADCEPLPDVIVPWSMEVARQRFLERFAELGGRYAV